MFVLRKITRARLHRSQYRSEFFSTPISSEHKVATVSSQGYNLLIVENSVILTIPKKPGTISMISYIVKGILRIVLERIRAKIKNEIAEEQYGLTEGKGTKNAVFMPRMLSERSIKMQKDMY